MTSMQINEKVEVYEPKGRSKWVDIIIGFDKWAEKWYEHHTKNPFKGGADTKTQTTPL